MEHKFKISKDNADILGQEKVSEEFKGYQGNQVKKETVEKSRKLSY